MDDYEDLMDDYEDLMDDYQDLMDDYQEGLGWGPHRFLDEEATFDE